MRLEWASNRHCRGLEAQEPLISSHLISREARACGIAGTVEYSTLSAVEYKSSSNSLDCVQIQ